jgi:general secretion pathway protein G
MSEKIRKNKGFTLVELMIAMGIIIALGTVVLVNISTYLRGGRIAQARTNIAVISSAIGRYRYVHGTMPENLRNLTAHNANGNNGQLLTDAELKDPWDNPYNYNLSEASEKYAIWSNGPDRTNNSGSTMPSAFTGDDVGVILTF